MIIKLYMNVNIITQCEIKKYLTVHKKRVLHLLPKFIFPSGITAQEHHRVNQRPNQNLTIYIIMIHELLAAAVVMEG